MRLAMALAFAAMALAMVATEASPSSSPAASPTSAIAEPPARPPPQRRACEEGGICSVGSSKQWVGDIRDSNQFKQMLQAVSHKQELMVAIFQHNTEYLPVWEDLLLQLHYELLAGGYAHFVVIALDKQGCDLVARPTLSCVWDSSDKPDWVVGGVQALTNARLKLTARAARLGYNVMLVDTDSILFRDPYVHLKGPAFQEFQMLCNPEGGALNCNTGFVYVQNARPDGPVTWLLMDTQRSLFRRADDHYQFLSRWMGHANHNCLNFDQAVLDDALATAAAGRPAAGNAVHACKPSATFTTRHGNALDSAAVERNVQRVVSPHLRARKVKVSPDAAWLLNVTGLRADQVPQDDQVTWTTSLTVPNMRLGWPEELGGRLWPEGPLGNFSSAWARMLREDCPQCPWWPEERELGPEGDPLPRLFNDDFTDFRGGEGQVNASTISVFTDPHVPQERFLLTPRWLASSMCTMRRGMYAGPGAWEHSGYLAVGHVHAWHLQSSQAHKVMLRKILGRYNWTLATELAQARARPVPYLHGKHEVQRVLALSPAVDLSRTRSWSELASILAGLIQVAWLSQRVVVLPELPCETAWLHPQETLSKATNRRTVCMAPTFWEFPHKYPLPLPVPVDARGELVGGWARRLTGSDNSRASGAILLAPQPTDGAGAAGQGTAHGRALSAAGQPNASWWEQQRFVAALPPLWDETCTVGMHGIIGAELFHWLRHSPEGRRATQAPSESNTVLRADPKDARLALRPALGEAQASSRQVPLGEVVPPSSQEGWSWWDVQVALSAGEVAREMRRVAHEPLVYLGHPVMVVPEPAAAAAAGQAAHAGQQQRRRGLKGEPHQQQHRSQGHDHGGAQHKSPDERLRHINEQLHKRKCKGVWVDPEGQGQVVDLSRGKPGRIVAHGRVATAA